MNTFEENTSYNASADDVEEHTLSTLDIVHCVLFCVMALVIIGSNVTSLTVFIKSGLFKRKHLIPIVSLTVADLVVGFAIPFKMYNDYIFHATTSDSCMFYIMDNFLREPMHVSGLHLVVIAMDRFIAVMFPLRYETVPSPKMVKFTLAAVWIGPKLRLALGFGIAGCGSKWMQVSSLTEGVAFACVLGTMMCLYGRVWQVAKKQHSAVCAQQTVNSGEKQNAIDIKATRTVGCIILGYLCYLPIIILRLFLETGNQEIIFILQPWCVEVAFCSSWINFSIYVKTNRQFAEAYTKLRHGQISRVTSLTAD